MNPSSQATAPPSHPVHKPSPETRVFVFYLPHLTSGSYVQIDELFGALESWRFSFGIVEQPEKEPVCPSSRLHLSPLLPSSPLHHSRYLPPAAAAAPPPPPTSVSAPVINDFLILTDPLLPLHHLPDICQVMNTADGVFTYRQNIQSRLQAYKQNFQQQSDDSPHTDTTSTTTSTSFSSPSRCFVLRTFIASTQFHPMWQLHPAIHSVSVLGEPGVAAVLLLYDLALRSDNDCFLTPALNLPENIPWRLPSKRGKKYLRGRGEKKKVEEEGGEEKTKTALQGSSTSATASGGGGEEDVVFGIRTAAGADTTVAPSGGGRLDDEDEDEEVLYEFFVGGGGYDSPMVSQMLEEYSKLLRLRYRDMHNIGSSWYGRPEDIINAARLTQKVGAFLLSTDPVIVRGVGEWPTWYRGVTLLYGSEIALNHLMEGPRQLRIRRDLLDTHTNGNDLLVPEVPGVTGGDVDIVADDRIEQLVAAASEMGQLSQRLHIHSWHTSEFYSKFVFQIGGKYDERFFKSPTYNINRVSWYAFTNVWNGQQRRKLQEEKHEADKPLKDSSISFASPLIGATLTGLFGVCPKTHPHPFSHGRSCCSVATAAAVLPCRGEVYACVIPPCKSHDLVLAGPAVAGEGEEEGEGDVCTAKYPFPYKEGLFCCSYDQTCVGANIDLSAECCHLHSYRACEQPPCKLHEQGKLLAAAMGTYQLGWGEATEKFVDVGGGRKVKENNALIKELVEKSEALKQYRAKFAELGYIDR
eukprot:GHVS01036919.1.p1 GENE.GHVS01036919.1~~GHVS01036919.1.p1  ORF type:complete len:855 (-),score=236.01 GHVS01036919.1:466-2718(-)